MTISQTTSAHAVCIGTCKIAHGITKIVVYSAKLLGDVMHIQIKIDEEYSTTLITLREDCFVAGRTRTYDSGSIEADQAADKHIEKRLVKHRPELARKENCKTELRSNLTELELKCITDSPFDNARCSSYQLVLAHF